MLTSAMEEVVFVRVILVFCLTVWLSGNCSEVKVNCVINYDLSAAVIQR